MAKLIAITGTHGTGKTTLSFQLAAEYKKLGANVKIIQEVARSCPFPLNEKMTRETALWIYHEHSNKELEACKDHDVVICDRTSFDSFVYAEAMKLLVDSDIYRERFAAVECLEKYDKLYFVRPDESFSLKDDGIRNVDPNFQNEIDGIFFRTFEKNFTKYTLVKSSQIFDKDHKWTISL